MKTEGKRCPVIAITGSIGSGKSTVAGFFEEKGALIIDADALAKKILWNDTHVHQQVINEYGRDICDEEGSISKERLIAKVFQNRDTIQRLNTIVHPHVIEKIRNIADKNVCSGEYSLIAVDAALIFEAGIEREFDCVVAVAAGDDRRIARVVARDGVKPDDVLRRMSLQNPPDEHIQKSDYILNNNGSLSDLRSKSMQVFEHIMETDFVHQ